MRQDLESTERVLHSRVDFGFPGRATWIGSPFCRCRDRPAAPTGQALDVLDAGVEDVLVSTSGRVLEYGAVEPERRTRRPS